MPQTKIKLIVTPNAIHAYQFSKPITYGTQPENIRLRPKRRRKRDLRAGSLPRDYIRNGWRAKKQIGLILESNTILATFDSGSKYRPLFVTLTFAENVTDLTRANKEFNLFIKRFNYELRKTEDPGFTVQYLVVPEFQKRGAVHYHVIFFKFPKLDDTNKFINQVWKHGFTFNTTLSNPQHLKNYVTKYFVKNFLDPRLYGKKHFFYSRGLKKPQVFYNHTNNEAICEQITNSDYEQTYTNGTNLIQYSLHNNHPLIPLIYYSVDNSFDEKKS